MMSPCDNNAEKSPLRSAGVGTVRGPGSGNWSYNHSTAPKKKVRLRSIGPPRLPPGRSYLSDGLVPPALFTKKSVAESLSDRL